MRRVKEEVVKKDEKTTIVKISNRRVYINNAGTGIISIPAHSVVKPQNSEISFTINYHNTKLYITARVSKTQYNIYLTISKSIIQLLQQTFNLKELKGDLILKEEQGKVTAELILKTERGDEE